MTASVRNLSVLSYAAGFTGWVYRDPNTALADMLKPGFFGLDGFSDMVTDGDTVVLVGARHTAFRVFRCTHQGQVQLEQVF